LRAVAVGARAVCGLGCGWRWRRVGGGSPSDAAGDRPGPACQGPSTGCTPVRWRRARSR
jgi:hypothetical protein